MASTHKCCCDCNINGGRCNSFHKCKMCKEYLHAICGHEYYDTNGKVVDDDQFPRICNRCHENVFNSGDQTPPLPPLTEKTVQDDEVCHDNQYFTAEEREKVPKGWFVPYDIEKFDNVLDRYKDYPPGVNLRTKIIEKIVYIPAIYWGESDIDSEWWKDEEKYELSLTKLSKEEMKKVVLVAKVIDKASSRNEYNIAFFSSLKNNHALSGVAAKDIRRFLTVGPASTTTTSTTANKGRKENRKEKSSTSTNKGRKGDRKDKSSTSTNKGRKEYTNTIIGESSKEGHTHSFVHS